jgi:hypothetical protein
VNHVIDTRRGAASSRAARHDIALEAGAMLLALAADPAPLAFADAMATALLVTGEALAPARLAAVTQLMKPRNAPWSAVAGPTTLRTRATTLTPITR